MGCNKRRVNTTNLARTDGGDLIKQGDLSSTFGFELLDENYRVMTSFEGQVFYPAENTGWKSRLEGISSQAIEILILKLKTQIKNWLRKISIN